MRDFVESFSNHLVCLMQIQLIVMSIICKYFPADGEGRNLPGPPLPLKTYFL